MRSRPTWPRLRPTTPATIRCIGGPRRRFDDPQKAAKHRRSFAVRISGAEVYPKPAADALEAALLPLVDGDNITRVSKQDTNPANNLPVPAEYR